MSNEATNVTIENLILSGLLQSEQYVRKVLPYLQIEYFAEKRHQIMYTQISQYVEKYNGLPSPQALQIELEATNVTQKDYEAVTSLITEVASTVIDTTEAGMVWLTEQSEKFCKDRAIYNAVVKAATVLDGTNSDTDKNSLPDVLQQALAVSFDSNIGHDFSDAERRYEFYHTDADRLRFDITMLNQITGGGLLRKTLTLLLGSTGGGKSLTMCHMAAAAYKAGRNVLYITLEMSEEKIAERIDANLLNQAINTIPSIPKDLYVKQIKRIQSQTTGKLVIKEYPTTGANVNHIRHLLMELKLKKKFIPDVIFIDYLNIMSSSRMKMGGTNVSSYGFIKAIAEEVRGLAVEFNLPIISATQVNRGGMGSTDPDLTDTSDSIGMTFTADLFLALSASEDMIKLNQMVITQLKNRYGDTNRPRKFIVGCDRSKMKLYDVEDAALDELSNDPNFQDRSYKDGVPEGEPFFGGSLADDESNRRSSGTARFKKTKFDLT